MVCQWSGTWSPSPLLEECGWVACLAPPRPPQENGLRVTGWYGAPVRFGDTALFVCERGLRPEDPSTSGIGLSCQDGSAPGREVGSWDTPSEEEWPRCVRNVLCSEPPEPPEAGSREFRPIIYEVDLFNSSAAYGKILELSCHSFLRIIVQNASSKAKVAKEMVDELVLAKSSCEGRESCLLALPKEMGEANQKVIIHYTCGKGKFRVTMTKQTKDDNYYPGMG